MNGTKYHQKHDRKRLTRPHAGHDFNIHNSEACTSTSQCPSPSPTPASGRQHVARAQCPKQVEALPPHERLRARATLRRFWNPYPPSAPSNTVRRRPFASTRSSPTRVPGVRNAKTSLCAKAFAWQTTVPVPDASAAAAVFAFHSLIIGSQASAAPGRTGRGPGPVAAPGCRHLSCLSHCSALWYVRSLKKLFCILSQIPSGTSNPKHLGLAGIPSCPAAGAVDTVWQRRRHHSRSQPSFHQSQIPRGKVGAALLHPGPWADCAVP